MIDAQGNTTVVEYDKLGRRELIDNPDTGLTTYGYDLAGNLISKQTANLKTESRFISYVYDYGRLTEINYNGTIGNPRDVTYTYGAPNAANNQAGRVVSMTHQAGSDTRKYGALGEVSTRRRAVSPPCKPRRRLSCTPPRINTTAFGRLLRLTYPDAEVLTNTYDSGGNLASVKGNKNGYKYKYINDLYYDHFEQRVRVEAANRVNTSYGYDTYNRRLERLVVEKNGQENLIDLDYTYDEVGNITKLDNVLTGTISNQFGRLDIQNFEYDDLNRLTHADGMFNLPQGQGKTRAYSLDMKYDTVHNILSKTQVDNITQSSGTLIPQKKTSYAWNYRYPAATTARPHAPQQIGVAGTAGVITGRTFSYDLNGNQTGWTHDSNGTRRTIAWDEENRIQSIADNGHVKDYTYDADGQRVSKRGPQGETVYVNQFFTMRNSTQGTKHVYAGTQRMVSKLMKQDGPGANPKGKTPYEKDQYYYHPDHLGSSSLVTDAGGKIYQHLTYFPFGETWVDETSNTQRTPYWFTAKELDEETGLYYFGARYYDPRTSVWQSADPILDQYLGNNPRDVRVGGVFEPTNLSMYSYSRNSPVVLKDPDGRVAPIIWGIFWLLAREAGSEVVTATTGVEIPTIRRVSTKVVKKVVKHTVGIATATAVLNEATKDDEGESSDDSPAIEEDKGRTSEEEALNDIIKDLTNDGRKPLTSDDADAGLELGDELGLDTRDDRGEKGDKKGEGKNHWEGGDHIHIEKIRVRKGGSHIKADPPSPVD